MTVGQAEGRWWAAYLVRRPPRDARDGALAVAGGHALCAAATFLRYAVGIGDDGPLRSDDLAAIVAFYAERGLEARLELDAAVAERDARTLAAAGFVPDGSTLVVAEAACDTVPPARGSATAERTGDAARWIALVVDAFADVTPPEDRERLVAATTACAEAAAALFVGTVAGEEAGGGAVALLDEARALLFSGAVLPPYRGRGVHRALTAARTDVARAAGARSVVFKTGSPVLIESLHARGFRAVAERRRWRRPIAEP